MNAAVLRGDDTFARGGLRPWSTDLELLDAGDDRDQRQEQGDARGTRRQLTGIERF